MSYDDDREVFPFPGKVKSSVWEFFGFYKDDYGNLDKSRAICKICRKGTNYSGNTTNLRTHIVHHHKDVAALPEVNYTRTPHSRSSSSSQNHENSFSSTHQYHIITSPEGISQMTAPKIQRQMVFDEILIPPLPADISGTLSKSSSHHNAWVVETASGLADSPAIYRKDSPGQEHSGGSSVDFETDSYGGTTSVKDAVFESVVHDMIPIETIESPRFKKLIAGGKRHVTIPTSEALTNMILRHHSEVKKVVKNELSQTKHTSLKIDIWESGDITYMTVSIQALLDGWKMRCFVICTVELKESFTLADLEGSLSKDKIWCCFDGKVLLSNELPMIEELANAKDCVHIVAICSTINTVAKLCLEESVGEKILAKVQNIVHFLNENQKGKAVLSEKQRVLQLPIGELINCTRKLWDTCLTMFESVLGQSNAIIASFSDPKVKSLAPPKELSSSDFALIQTFINMLVPLKTALNLTKDMKCPTAAVILPVLKKLEMSFACKETDSSQIVDLKTKMVTVLKQRYEEVKKKRFLLLCSLLDPRFKGLKFVNQTDQDAAFEQLKQEAMVMKNLTKTEGETKLDLPEKCIVKIEVDDNAESQGSFDLYLKEEEMDRSSPPQMVKKRKLSKTSSEASGSGSAADDWFADVIQETKDNQSEEDSVIMEINRYKAEMQISSGSSPLSWWRDRQKSFPLLSQVAQRYVTAPALLGSKTEKNEQWYQRQRRCLPAHLVDSIIFLHANYEQVKRLGDEL